MQDLFYSTIYHCTELKISYEHLTIPQLEICSKNLAPGVSFAPTVKFAPSVSSFCTVIWSAISSLFHKFFFAVSNQKPI